MTEIRIDKQEDKAEVFVGGNSLGELSPQEMWDLSEQLRKFSISNADSFKSKPKSVISIKDLKFNVIAGFNTDYWTLVNSGKWEPETFDVFDRFIDSKTTFLDIGAWIGSTSLYGAQRAKMTHAFEPDPVAYETFQSNTLANRAEWVKSLQLHNAAIGAEEGFLQIGNPNEAGNSMSSALFTDGAHSWKVKCLDISKFISDNQLKDQRLFLKIDIEGGEYELLPKIKDLLKNTDSRIMLSIHGNFLLKSLRNEISGPFKELKVRWTFYKKHKRLLKSLPYKNIEHADGRPVNVSKRLLKSLLLGIFVTEVVAY